MAVLWFYAAGGSYAGNQPSVSAEAKSVLQCPALGSLRALDIADGQLKWQVSAYAKSSSVISPDGGTCILLLLLWLLLLILFLIRQDAFIALILTHFPRLLPAFVPVPSPLPLPTPATGTIYVGCDAISIQTKQCHGLAAWLVGPLRRRSRTPLSTAWRAREPHPRRRHATLQPQPGAALSKAPGDERLQLRDGVQPERTVRAQHRHIGACGLH